MQAAMIDAASAGATLMTLPPMVVYRFVVYRFSFGGGRLESATLQRVPLELNRCSPASCAGLIRASIFLRKGWIASDLGPARGPHHKCRKSGKINPTCGVK